MSKVWLGLLCGFTILSVGYVSFTRNIDFISLIIRQVASLQTPEEDKAIREDPDNELAYHHRAFVRMEFWDYQGAIADYTQIIRIVSKKTNSPITLAESYSNRSEAYRLLAGSQRGIEAKTESYQSAILDAQKSADLYQKKGEMDQYRRTLDHIRWLRHLLSDVETLNQN